MAEIIKIGIDVDVDVILWYIRKGETMFDYSDFLNWLIVEKKMNQRSAKDVISRCKRVGKFLNIDELNSDSSEKLLQNEEYKASSMFIKSQLKRAVALYKEFTEGK